MLLFVSAPALLPRRPCNARALRRAAAPRPTRPRPRAAWRATLPPDDDAGAAGLNRGLDRGTDVAAGSGYEGDSHDNAEAAALSVAALTDRTAVDAVLAGTETVSVALPLGAYIEHTSDGLVFVDALEPDGNAAASGLLREGDVIVAVSLPFGDSLQTVPVRPVDAPRADGLSVAQTAGSAGVSTQAQEEPDDGLRMIERCIRSRAEPEFLLAVRRSDAAETERLRERIVDEMGEGMDDSDGDNEWTPEKFRAFSEKATSVFREEFPYVPLEDDDPGIVPSWENGPYMPGPPRVPLDEDATEALRKLGVDMDVDVSKFTEIEMPNYGDPEDPDGPGALGDYPGASGPGGNGVGGNGAGGDGAGGNGAGGSGDGGTPFKLGPLDGF